MDGQKMNYENPIMDVLRLEDDIVTGSTITDGGVLGGNGDDDMFGPIF